MKRVFLICMMLVSSVFARTPMQSDSVSQWCDDRLMTLKQARDEARWAYQAGDLVTAEKTLEDGFYAATQEIRGYYTGALTAKAIIRGYRISQAVRGAVQSRQLAAKSLIHFMFSYVEFIENVANVLDKPYFSPSSCAYCEGPNHLDFEAKFLTFARHQSQIVLDTMTTQNGSMIYPMGETAAYLKALEYSLGYTAYDLSNSLYAKNYSCQIVKAQRLKDKIVQAKFPNEVWAVNSTYHEATALLNPSSCDQGQGGSTASGATQTDEILYQSQNIYDGRSVSVPLGASRYIKKLIISAEGLNSRDAIFDVVVNGDIKGTIYVPGRDPAYFVTVEARASSIEFISRSGSARVLQIKVVSK